MKPRFLFGHNEKWLVSNYDSNEKIMKEVLNVYFDNQMLELKNHTFLCFIDLSNDTTIKFDDWKSEYGKKYIEKFHFDDLVFDDCEMLTVEEFRNMCILTISNDKCQDSNFRLWMQFSPNNRYLGFINWMEDLILMDFEKKTIRCFQIDEKNVHSGQVVFFHNEYVVLLIDGVLIVVDIRTNKISKYKGILQYICQQQKITNKICHALIEADLENDQLIFILHYITSNSRGHNFGKRMLIDPDFGFISYVTEYKFTDSESQIDAEFLTKSIEDKETTDVILLLFMDANFSENKLVFDRREEISLKAHSVEFIFVGNNNSHLVMSAKKYYETVDAAPRGCFSIISRDYDFSPLRVGMSFNYKELIDVSRGEFYSDFSLKTSYHCYLLDDAIFNGRYLTKGQNYVVEITDRNTNIKKSFVTNCSCGSYYITSRKIFLLGDIDLSMNLERLPPIVLYKVLTTGLFDYEMFRKTVANDPSNNTTKIDTKKEKSKHWQEFLCRGMYDPRLFVLISWFASV